MPPRWFCLLVVASWFALNGWLFYDDLLPRLLPGQAPPVTIDVVEEAQLRRPAANWTCQRNGHEAFAVKARIEHPRRETFDLVADFALPRRAGKSAAVLTNAMAVTSMTSRYRVNAAGDVLAFDVRFTATAQLLDQLPQDLDVPLRKEFTAGVRGEVEGGRLRLVRELFDGDDARTLSETSVGVGRGGAVLLPLHPVKRMRGLSPGQHWRTVLLDPLAHFLLPADPPVLRARVRAKTEPLTIGRRAAVECLVIDYEGDRVKVTTWVNREDGAVLSQEASLDGTRWVTNRD